MSEKVYTVKEVTEMLSIEAYVLRYYEKELKLDIRRNKQGHRVYNDNDVELLAHIRDLREQGLALRAVKNVLNNGDQDGLVQMTNKYNKASVPTLVTSKEIDITDAGDEHVMQFSIIMKEMLKQALVEFHQTAKEETKEEIKEELSQEINHLVEKKIREIEVVNREKSESYYHQMDETMRDMQRMQKELARLKEPKKKESRIRRFFGSKKIDLSDEYGKESM